MLVFVACKDDSSDPVDLTITGFSPESGQAGDVVEISGTGFTSDSKVFFNGEDATVKTVSDTLLAVYVPQEAITGYIAILDDDQSAQSSSKFTITTDDSSGS